MAAIARRPEPNSTSRSLSASFGHGSRSSGALSDKRLSVDADIGIPV